MKNWIGELKELENYYLNLKGQIKRLEEELGKLLKTEDEVVVLLYSRRCLEVIVTDLCERKLERSRGTEPLKGIIDKLSKEKEIPEFIATSMYNLNSISTYGAHPKDFSPRQVRTVLIDLTTIIEWYIEDQKGLITPTSTSFLQTENLEKEIEHHSSSRFEKSTESIATDFSHKEGIATSSTKTGTSVFVPDTKLVKSLRRRRFIRKNSFWLFLIAVAVVLLIVIIVNSFS